MMWTGQWSPHMSALTKLDWNVFLYISVGYVKTEMVEIDFSALKNQGLSLPLNLENEEVYDDVESMDNQG